MFAGHNIGFDKRFVSLPQGRSFCTMRDITKILKMPQKGDQSYKPPKLYEAAKILGIKYEEDKFHNSMYDVEITGKILNSLLAAFAFYLPNTTGEQAEETQKRIG